MDIRDIPHPAPTSVPFSFRRRERAIRLHRGPLELQDDGKVIARGDGDVFFSWLPNPGIRFSLPDQELGGISGETRLSVPALQLDARVLLTHWSLSGGDIRGVINRAPFPSTEAISYLRFAIPNYLIMNRADPLHENRAGRQHAWAGRTVLEAEGWRLTLDARPDSRVVKERLQARSGYEVTHTGDLVRVDGAPFSDAAAADKLVALAHFFGLTRGGWAPPILAHGYDARGRIVWRDWNPPTISPWRSVMNVIDVFHPESLQDAFHGYLRRWDDPLWREPLLYATQMYVEANGPVFAETSLVLTQAALELIAWVRIVEDEKSLTRVEFEKLQYGAADRLRKLFEWLRLDPSIPETLTALSSEANRLGWVDGPHAIDAMRNALIHASKRDRIGNTELNARIDLHELALWYVELALLRILNFESDYSSRLHSHSSGSVFAVPWATD